MIALKKSIRVAVLSAFICLCLPGISHAETTETSLITSMEERLPVLMDLKLAGKVGETNRAMVSARADLERSERRILADENADRLAHYTLIAKRLKVSVEVVQLKRAEQIREKSAKGIWIQSKSGDWYRE
ncbi:MAG: DUF1318 domain-containing protein [Opitutales bacterium]|jgi:uncharacterized protein|nr:DUF1318 domain-containing protein [Opitutales bacterium]MDP4645464.1 DUF1318 domain-containing protein [Opitutales bacterium]MDP4693635.1 DUF1318 domain-containing protein [Opitutales bacterium]MDP4778218.1 DUF1318 domain-containing protein [Opitutales bacterium]MDP4883681.1 DUF1318 domain-containing protein [Opitutales bacterium]